MLRPNSVLPSKFGQQEIQNESKDLCGTKKSLKEAKYFLKTKFGVLDVFINHSIVHPIFGAGQGSGNSLTYCLFRSSTLLDIYDAKAHGSVYQSPNKAISVEVKAIGLWMMFAQASMRLAITGSPSHS